MFIYSRPPEKPAPVLETVGDLDDIKELDDNDIDSEKSFDLMQENYIQDELEVSCCFFSTSVTICSISIIS